LRSGILIEHAAALSGAQETRYIISHDHLLDEAEHPDVGLDDTASLLRSIRDRPVVTLRCEGDGDFLIGRVLRVGARSAVFHPFDTAGKWFRDATTVKLADVTCVRVGYHYAAVYERYVRPWKAPQHTNPRSSEP
jgi:hypothetical protein